MIHGLGLECPCAMIEHNAPKRMRNEGAVSTLRKTNTTTGRFRICLPISENQLSQRRAENGMLEIQSARRINQLMMMMLMLTEKPPQGDFTFLAVSQCIRMSTTHGRSYHQRRHIASRVIQFRSYSCAIFGHKHCAERERERVSITL